MKQDLSDETNQPAGQDDARLLLPGYALGIATEDEARQVEALLAEQPELRAEVADYHRLSAALLAGTPRVEPPAGALERLMQATAEPQDASDAALKPASLLERLLSPRLRLSPALAAALLVVWLGVVGVLAAQVNTLSQQREQLLADRQQQDVALALMRARDVRWIKMNETADAQPAAAFAWLIYSPGRQSGVILTNDFPPLGEDMAYQLWVARDDQPISLGLFRVNPDGSGAYIFQLPDDIAQYQRMGITPEPAGGSPGPTAPPVVRLDLARFRS